MTLISDGHVPGEIYEGARRHFTEAKLVNLTLAMVAINGWNRLNIRFRTFPAVISRSSEFGSASAR